MPALGGMVFGMMLMLFFVHWYNEAHKEKRQEQKQETVQEPIQDREQKQEREKVVEVHDMKYVLVASRIERLYRTKTELDEVEYTLSNLQCCSPEGLSQNFRLGYTTTDGKERSIDFMAHGGAEVDTLNLNGLVEGKRKELRTSLLNQIADLYNSVLELPKQ